MQYTIDEQGIHYKIEDDEADRVARIVAQRRLVAVEPKKPEISLSDAVKECQKISEQQHAWEKSSQHAALDGCECDRIGVRRCGMCE